MSPGTAELETQIQCLRQTLAILRARLREEGPSGEVRASLREMVEDTLQELQTSLEELEVSYEELLAQDNALQSALATARIERQRYQELFDEAPEAFIVTDARGVIREGNKAAARLLNTSPQFLVNHPIASFISQEERPSIRGLIDGSVEQTQEWDVQMRPRNAAAFAAALTMTPMTDARGAVQALRWHLRDVTERTMLACLWRMRNRTRELRAVVLKTSVGLELRVVQPDGVVISSELQREWPEVLVRSEELRKTLEAKGWQRSVSGPQGLAVSQI